eukprot:4893043-Pyramimonas_sp.AAC.1
MFDRVLACMRLDMTAQGCANPCRPHQAVELSLACYSDMGQSFRAQGPMASPEARPFGPMLEKHWDHNH